MTSWIKTIIESFSYPGIMLLMLLENVFPPIPSELIMPLAGFLTTNGHLTLGGLIAAGTLGSVAGAIVLYYVGRQIGGERLRAWSDRHGRWVGLSRADLDKSDEWFKRHGGKTVLLGRLVPGVRSLISIPAGVSKMDLRVFLVYTTLGSAGWTATLAYAGRLLGNKYEQVEHVIGPVSTVIVVGIIVTLVIRGFRQRPTARS